MTFCVYDGPSPEAIRRAAEANQLPVYRITEVRVLDPTSTAEPPDAVLRWNCREVRVPGSAT
jgi:hypothetical protein